MPEYIYVVGMDGKPQMPTRRRRHVNKLLNTGKARIAEHVPFTIQLLYENEPVLQQIMMAEDPGRTNIGAAVVGLKGQLYLPAVVETRNKEIRKLMDKRRACRRECAIQTVEDMAEHLPNGLMRDADTVLADIMQEANFEINGLAKDIFNIWRKSSDRKSVEQMFFEITDYEFLDYLKKCQAVMQAVYMADAVGKWLKEKGLQEGQNFSALIENLSEILEIWEKSEIKENRAEFFGRMIDQVETYLEVFGFEQKDIFSNNRNHAAPHGEEPDGLALIYGEDYDYLSAKFAEILKL